jgi:hypothetical protein
MDNVHELGKNLKSQSTKAKYAVEKQNAEYPTTETVRDIFDSVVSYRAHFKTTRKGMSVKADLQFELPPPTIGSGNCCGDCFCTACEMYLNADFVDGLGYTTYPYLPGTLRIRDSHTYDSPVVEADPTTGTFVLDYTPSTADPSYVLYACYVYKYDGHCTTNISANIYTESFTRVTPQTWTRSAEGITYFGLGTSDASYVWDATKGFLSTPEAATGNVDLNGTTLSINLNTGASSTYESEVKQDLVGLPDLQDYIQTTEFTIDTLGGIDNSFIEFIRYAWNGVTSNISGSVVITSTTIYLGTRQGGFSSLPDETTSHTLTTGITYKIKQQFDYTTKVNRVKIWDALENEPETWLLSQDISTYTFNWSDALYQFYRIRVKAYPNEVVNVTFDNIIIEGATN